MRLYLALLSTVLLSFVYTSSTNAQTITEIVANSGGEFDNVYADYDILLNAVLAADLADALDNPEDDLTVFAPNDMAFVRTARELGYDGWSEAGAWDFLVTTFTSLGNGDPIPVLREVLLYHVVGESLRPWQIFFRDVETLQGESFYVRFFELQDQDDSLANPFLIIPLNIRADNGLIHTISRVLIPFENMQPTIADIVAESGGEFDSDFLDYDILLTALTAADLVNALDNPMDDLTTFAPNDLAFVRTARDLGYNGWSEEGAWEFLVVAFTDLGGGDPIPVLREVLLYHVVPKKLKPWQFIYSKSIETLQGGVIRPVLFRLRDNEPDLPDPSLFVPVNISASNGIIHTINRVLIPIDLP